MACRNTKLYIRSKSNALWLLTQLFCEIAGTSVTLLSIFLLLSSDVERNPRLNKNITLGLISPFVFRHWIVWPHTILKKIISWSLNHGEKKRYNLFISMILNSSNLIENNNLKLNSYKIKRADHPNNVKRGVYTYIRESFIILLSRI